MWPEKVDLWHRSITNSAFDHRATIKQTTVRQKGQIHSARANVCDSMSRSSVCVAQVLILTASTAKQCWAAYITHIHGSRTNHALCTSEWKKLSCEVLVSGLLRFRHQSDLEDVKWCWWRHSQAAVMLILRRERGQMIEVCKLRSRAALGSCWLFVWHVCSGLALQNRETVTKQTSNTLRYSDINCDS